MNRNPYIDIPPREGVVPDANLMARVVSDEVVETAYAWLCRQRSHFPPNADVWHLRFHWERERPLLVAALLSGEYRLSPVQLVTKASGEQVALWSASDALVLKMLALVLETVLPVHEACKHVKGRGGYLGSVGRTIAVIRRLRPRYVARTDIKGYYQHIQPNLLRQQLVQHVHDPRVMAVLDQFLSYLVEDREQLWQPSCGISRGCALSPLLGAFHLYGLDVRLSSLAGVTYERYMDDFLILTSDRWRLRRAIRSLNQAFGELGFVQHPLKTFFGRLSRGVEWLGYALDEDGRSTPSPRSVLAWMSRQVRPHVDVSAWRAFAYRKWRWLWPWEPSDDGGLWVGEVMA